jgi:hypothetical protein
MNDIQSLGNIRAKSRDFLTQKQLGFFMGYLSSQENLVSFAQLSSCFS